MAKKREILTYPHPVLADKAREVEGVTDEIRSLAADMVETMYAESGIGLAAPQVGESLRLIVVDVTGPEQRSGLMALVNPRVAECEGEIDSDEGCLSVPEFRSKVRRAEKVRVEALDLDGRRCVVDADGMLAICLQHEIDHLDGVLFIDRVSRLKRTLYDRKVRKWLRQQDQ